MIAQATNHAAAWPEPRWAPAGCGAGHWELFAESIRLHQPLLPVVGHLSPPGCSPGQPPPLDELRLHQGTVWRWNLSDPRPAACGHLRIEMRALPLAALHHDRHAGQRRVPDRAVPVGGRTRPAVDLRTAVRTRRPWVLPRRPARPVRPADLAGRAPRPDTDRSLPPSLSPSWCRRHDRGYPRACVAAAEADTLLDVISARAASGQTGAAWQRATLAAAEQRHDQQHALAVMLDRYLRCADTGLPVHTWPVSGPARQRTIAAPRLPRPQKVGSRDKPPRA